VISWKSPKEAATDVSTLVGKPGSSKDAMGHYLLAFSASQTPFFSFGLSGLSD
jgi:hypothetical protein